MDKMYEEVKHFSINMETVNYNIIKMLDIKI